MELNKSRILHLLITTGENEEVLVVLERERHPNQFGEVTPPVMVWHEDKEYMLKRKYLQDTYVYGPSDRKQVDDFLAETPS